MDDNRVNDRRNYKIEFDQRGNAPGDTATGNARSGCPNCNRMQAILTAKKIQAEIQNQTIENLMRELGKKTR